MHSQHLSELIAPNTGGAGRAHSLLEHRVEHLTMSRKHTHVGERLDRITFAFPASSCPPQAHHRGTVRVIKLIRPPHFRWQLTTEHTQQGIHDVLSYSPTNAPARVRSPPRPRSGVVARRERPLTSPCWRTQPHSGQRRECRSGPTSMSSAPDLGHPVRHEDESARCRTRRGDLGPQLTNQLDADLGGNEEVHVPAVPSWVQLGRVQVREGLATKRLPKAASEDATAPHDFSTAFRTMQTITSQRGAPTCT